MSDEDRDREERRREETRREEEERQRRKRAEDDRIFHEGLRSGDYSRWLARRGYESPAETRRPPKLMRPPRWPDRSTSRHGCKRLWRPSTKGSSPCGLRFFI